MKVAILEIYGHHLFVATLATCLLESGHEVRVYSHKRIYDDIKEIIGNHPKLSVALSNEDETDFHFLRRTKAEIEQENDLLIIPTIQGYRILWFYILHYKIKTVGAAGRISEFFNHKFNFKYLFSIRSLSKYFVTWLLLPQIVKRLSGLIVHTPKAYRLAEKSYFDGVIHVMPFALQTKHRSAEKKRTVMGMTNVLITGSLSDTSRDYFAVLSVFERIWKFDKSTLPLCVLGTPRTKHGQAVYQKMVSLKENGAPIEFFDKWIPEAIYMDRVRNADLILAPVRAPYYSSGELTSVHVEVARFGKIGIFPSWYRHDSALDEFCFYFEDYDVLYALLKEIASTPQPLSVERIKAATDYGHSASPAVCAPRFENFVASL